MEMMNDDQRLQLQQMISANNVEDCTDLIRKLKHSKIMRENISELLNIIKTHPDDNTAVINEGAVKCKFLFNYYTDIFNKICKNEIDLNILYRAFDVLESIEDGKIDQHQGAYEFGTLLKQVYIDSALKKAEKLNNQYGDKNEYKGAQEQITWKQFKKNGKR